MHLDVALAGDLRPRERDADQRDRDGGDDGLAEPAPGRRRRDDLLDHRQIAEPRRQLAPAHPVVRPQRHHGRGGAAGEPEQRRSRERQLHGSLRSRVLASKRSITTSKSANSANGTNSSLSGTRSVIDRFVVSSVLRTVWKPLSNEL